MSHDLQRFLAFADTLADAARAAILPYFRAAHGVGDALNADPRVFVFGEDVGGKYGNAFLLLRPLLAEHGDRILNSPLAEGAVIGGAIGAALAGLRPIAEMQFNDFVATGFNQLVNNAAKIRYMSGGQFKLPLVFRGPNGAAGQLAATHNTSVEAIYAKFPGLKVVSISNPDDAKGLLKAAIRDDDPVIFLESELMYGMKGEVSDEPDYVIPLGRARVAREGEDVTIVAHTEPLDIEIFARDNYYFNYKNDKFKAVLADAAKTTDEKARYAKYAEAQKILAEDVPALFLFQLPKLGVWNAKVQGLWENSPIPSNDVTEVSWTE